MSRRIRSTRVLAATFALTSLLTLAACSGGGSGSGVASAGTNASNEREQSADDESRGEFSEEDALEFSKCMRKNGVEDFPDPDFSGEGGVRFGFRAEAGADGDTPGNRPPFDPNDGTFQKAREACEEFMPNGGNFQRSPEEQAAMEDAQLKFAQCMRGKGYDVPDPETSEGGGGPVMIGPGGRFGDLDPEDPDTRAAMDECQEAFRDVFGEDGPRFGSRVEGGDET
jgi:hypothetical protein